MNEEYSQAESYQERKDDFFNKVILGLNSKMIMFFLACTAAYATILIYFQQKVNVGYITVFYIAVAGAVIVWALSNTKKREGIISEPEAHELVLQVLNYRKQEVLNVLGLNSGTIKIIGSFARRNPYDHSFVCWIFNFKVVDYPSNVGPFFHAFVSAEGKFAGWGPGKIEEPELVKVVSSAEFMLLRKLMRGDGDSVDTFQM